MPLSVEDFKKYLNRYWNLGYNLIPINYGTKKPIVSWTEYQKKRTTEAQWDKWIAEHTNNGLVELNVAVVCGEISGKLAIIDFDKKKWCGQVLGAPQTIIIGTSKGKHAHYITEFPTPTRKGFRGLNIDIRGEGGYACIPPSHIRKSPENKKEFDYIWEGDSDVTPQFWGGDFETGLDAKLRKRFNKEMRKSERINITKLLEGNLKDGDGRAVSAFHLATYWRTSGLSLEDSWKKLVKWNKLNIDKLGEDELEHAIDSAFKKSTPYKIDFEVEKIELFTEQELANAEKLLNDPEFLWKLHEANRDIVREDKNRVLIPILEFGKFSFEVSGKTASGKNTLVDWCLKTIPTHWCEKVTGLSDKAVRYLPDNIRTLYIAERRGLKTGEESTAEYDVKVNISEGKLRIWVVMIEEGKKPEAVLIETGVENVIMTSTDITMPLELENRMLDVPTDESLKQNQFVQDRQLSEKAKLPSQRINTKAEKKLFRAAFTILDDEAPNDVVIPFANELKPVLPNLAPHIRRNTPKLLALIETVARIYYKQLPIVMDGDIPVIVATPEIFWLTWRIADRAITSAVIGLTDKQKKGWMFCKEMLLSDGQVTNAGLCKKMGFGSGSGRKMLNKFQDLGAIVKQKREGHWIWITGEKEFRESIESVDYKQLQEATETFLKDQVGNWEDKIHLKKLCDPLTGKSEVFK